jgi:hypothetical protein
MFVFSSFEASVTTLFGSTFASCVQIHCRRGDKVGSIRSISLVRGIVPMAVRPLETEVPSSRSGQTAGPHGRRLPDGKRMFRSNVAGRRRAAAIVAIVSTFPKAAVE